MTTFLRRESKRRAAALRSTRKTLHTDEDLYARLRDRVTPDGDCWRYTGRCNVHGYGLMDVPRLLVESSSIKFKRMEYAHRVAFAMRHGRLPWPGMHVDHLCRNRWCVNPDHLDEVTPRENLRRGASPSWAAHRERVCRRGHPLPAKGQCRVCANALRRREPTTCPPAVKSALWERCGERCDFCGNGLTRRGFHVHHRKLRSQGGTWALANLMAVHRTCHSGASYGIHANPLRSYELGHLVRSTDDPAEVPFGVWEGGRRLRTGQFQPPRIGNRFPTEGGAA